MTTPTLLELQQSILTDLRNRLGITSIVGKIWLNAIALVQAAKLKLYYLQTAFVYKNLFPDTADPASLEGTLERHGYVRLGRYPTPAIAGVYSVSVTGEVGAVIPAGTTYKSLDTASNPNKIYQLDSTFTFTLETGLIELRALEAGTNARLSIGDQVQLTQPISDVTSYGTVDSVVTEPTAAETTEQYRQEVLDSYQLEPQGGSKTDYRLWAADVEAVRSVYPYTTQPGIIDLYIEANVADSTDGKGTPSATTLSDVEDVIEFDPDITKPLNERGRRPMGAFQINFLPITALDVDVIINNLTDTSYLTTIQTSIEAFLTNIRPYIDGADNPNYTQKGLLYESDITNIIRNVIGNNASISGVTVLVNSSIIDIYEFENGDIPYLNSVTNV